MKKAVIIGAGISGLSAGIYARQSGFDVTIYESHTIPGGASTSWRRKGYLFEGGMHWLTGSSPATPLNRLWREVGALNDAVPVAYHEPFQVMEYQGQTACLYRDVDRLRAHFKELSPEDGPEIDKLCRDIKKFTKVNMPVMDLKGLKVKKKSSLPLSAIVGLLPALPRMSYYSGITCAEYAARYHSPLLRMLLEGFVGPEFTATALVFTLATLAAGDGGYPQGGSLSMARRMAEQFQRLGGVIHYGQAVERVIAEGGEARGVIVAGQRIDADAVIVTQDTRSAIDTLFETPIHEPWAEQMRAETRPMINTFISVGVEADLSDLPERTQFVSPTPLVCGGVPSRLIGLLRYTNTDYPGYAPKGCTAVTTIIGGDTYDYWKACRENGTYQAEKEKLAKAFIDILAKRYPQTAGKVAVWDVATPLTYERYLSSYRGSWMGIMGKNEKRREYPTKPDSIARLYFAGQRLQSPGGLPVALSTGRKAAQHLCLDFDAVFQGNLNDLPSGATAPATAR